MSNRVRTIREQAGMTLKTVSENVGCSIAFLSDIERDRRTAKATTWQRIADALGVTVEDLKDDNTLPDNPASGRPA